MSTDQINQTNKLTNNNKTKQNKQEFIPVGCVPPASVAISTGGAGGGVCLWVQGVSASGSRGCLPLGLGVSAFGCKGMSASGFGGYLPLGVYHTT